LSQERANQNQIANRAIASSTTAGVSEGRFTIEIT
jgi:hypothetical protein